MILTGNFEELVGSGRGGGLAADSGYARQYREFQRLMVYGAEVEYAACMGTLEALAGRFPEGAL